MGLFGCCCGGGCPTWRQFVANIVPLRVLNYLNCYYSTNPPGTGACMAFSFPNGCPYDDSVTPLTASDWQDAVDAGAALLQSVSFPTPPAPGTPDPSAPNWSSHHCWNGEISCSGDAACPDFRINAYLLTSTDTGGGILTFDYQWYPDNPVTFDPEPFFNELSTTYAGSGSPPVECNPFSDSNCQRILGLGCGASFGETVFGIPFGTPCSNRIGVSVWRSKAEPYSEICADRRTFVSTILGLTPDSLALAGASGCGPFGPVSFLECSAIGATPTPPTSWGPGVLTASDELVDWWIKHGCLDCVCP